MAMGLHDATCWACEYPTLHGSRPLCPHLNMRVSWIYESESGFQEADVPDTPSGRPA